MAARSDTMSYNLMALLAKNLLREFRHASDTGKRILRKTGRAVSRVLLLFIPIMLILSMTGCWSKYEINDVGITDSVVYDRMDDGKLKMTVEILNNKEGGASSSGQSEDGKSFYIFSGTASNVSESIANINKKFEWSLYLPFVRARIFTEKNARLGINSTLEYLLYNKNIRESAFMVISEGDYSAEDIYECLGGMSTTFGAFIDGLYNTRSETDGSSLFVDMMDFVRSLNSERTDPVAGLIKIMENQNESDIKQSGESKDGGEQSSYELVYEGAAVFRDDTMVGTLDREETQGYNFIMNNMRDCIISLNFHNIPCSVQILSSNCSKDVNYREGRLFADIPIDADVMLLEGQASSNIDISEIVEQLEQAISEHIKSLAEKCVLKTKNEYSCDIFGLGHSFYIKHTGEWHELKDIWRDVFHESEISVSVDVSLTRFGETVNPLA